MNKIFRLHLVALLPLFLMHSAFPAQAWYSNLTWNDTISQLGQHRAAFAVGAAGLALSGFLGYKLWRSNSKYQSLVKANDANKLEIKTLALNVTSKETALETLKLQHQQQLAAGREELAKDHAAKLQQAQQKIQELNEQNNKQTTKYNALRAKLTTFRQLLGKSQTMLAACKDLNGDTKKQLNDCKADMSKTCADAKKGLEQHANSAMFMRTTLALLRNNSAHRERIQPMLDHAKETITKAAQFDPSAQLQSKDASSVQSALNDVQGIRASLKKHVDLISFLPDRWQTYEKFASIVHDNFKSDKIEKIDSKDIYSYIGIVKEHAHQIAAKDLAEHVDSLIAQSLTAKDSRKTATLRQIRYFVSTQVIKENYDAFVAGEVAWNALKSTPSMLTNIQHCSRELQTQLEKMADLEDTLKTRLTQLSSPRTASQTPRIDSKHSTNAQTQPAASTGKSPSSDSKTPSPSALALTASTVAAARAAAKNNSPPMHSHTRDHGVANTDTKQAAQDWKDGTLLNAPSTVRHREAPRPTSTTTQPPAPKASGSSTNGYTGHGLLPSPKPAPEINGSPLPTTPENAEQNQSLTARFTAGFSAAASALSNVLRPNTPTTPQSTTSSSSNGPIVSPHPVDTDFTH